MKKWMKIAGLFLFTLPIAVQAQTITDDFTVASNWGKPLTDGGNISVGSGRMNYTASTTAEAFAGITRNTPLLPVTRDWSLQVDAHLSSLNLTTNDEGHFSDVFLGFGKTGSWIDNHLTFEFGQGYWGNPDKMGYYVSDDSRINGADVPWEDNLFDNYNITSSDVSLRMDYNAASHTVTYYLDADGAVGGYNWVEQGAANLASGTYNLNLKDTDTFTVFLLGSSASNAITAGQAYLDNLVITTAAVTSDPFAGTYIQWVLENDDYIEDGITLEQITGGSATISQTDATHYAVNLSGGGGNSVSLSAERVGNRLQSERSVDMGDWYVLDFLMLSDGTNRVFTMIGQDSPTDIGVVVGSRSSYAGNVTVDDFVGTWNADVYIDENLSDVSTGFEQQPPMAVEVQRIDATHVQVKFPEEDPIALRVSGNQAFLESPVNTTDVRYHTLRIRTDGQKMSFYAVGADLSDETAVFVPIGLGVKQEAPLTVINGSGGGSYTNGQQVIITASNAPAGKAFDRWTGSTQYVSSVTSATATVTMPTRAVTVTATYKAVYYALTVNGGTGGGSYTNGQRVTIRATVPAGMKFSDWNDGNTNALRIITMPAASIAYTANFTDILKPAVVVSTPTANLRILGTNGLYTVRGTAADNKALTNVLVQLNGGSWTDSTTTNGYKNWSRTVTLTNGINTIRACSVDTTGNHSLTSSVICTYVQTAVLTIQTNGPGTVTRLPAGVPEVGKTYTLTAVPAKTGSAFSGWSGDAAGTNKVVALVMTSNKTVMANFTDTAKPTVVITYPTRLQRVVTNGTVVLRGTATDNGRLNGVMHQLYTGEWTNAVSTNVWKNWSANFYPEIGLNTARVYSVDVQGNISATSTVVFTYAPGAVMTVQTNGAGTITPAYNGKVLEIGKSYIMTAKAVSGSVFSNWTYGIGGLVATNKTIVTFVMQSNLVLTANFRSLTKAAVADIAVDTPTPQVAITVDGSAKDWANVPSSSFSYASVTQEVAVALDGNSIALLLNGCPFGTSDTVLVYFKLRLSYGIGDNRHSVDLWTSGSVLYGMVDGQVIAGLEAVLLNGVLEVKLPVEQAPSQVTIEEIGCGMDLGTGTLTELFKLTPPSAFSQ